LHFLRFHLAEAGCCSAASLTTLANESDFGKAQYRFQHPWLLVPAQAVVLRPTF